MKNVLVINCGSSSVKVQLVDAETGNCSVKAIAERIGTEKASIKLKMSGNVQIINEQMNHRIALHRIVNAMKSDIIVNAQFNSIIGVGHRVVHGGETYSASMLIDDEVTAGIRNCNHMAPLHNPACLTGIRVMKKLLPDQKQVAVFDTAFHQTMKPEKFLYAIPRNLYEECGIRKYGFHGISHSFLCETMLEILKGNGRKQKCIQFHLGQGASLCAVKDGNSIDTTMGLSPLAGIIMGTRSGDIDPAIVDAIAKQKNLDAFGVIDLLNHESGMLALSGVSADFRDILKEAENGNPRAKMSLQMYYENVAEYAAKFVVALQGVKQFVFAGGIGENSPIIRSEICKKLQLFGVEIDEKLNAQAVGGKQKKISSTSSKIEVWVIPTNEEWQIAKEVVKVIG